MEAVAFLKIVLAVIKSKNLPSLGMRRLNVMRPFLWAAVVEFCIKDEKKKSIRHFTTLFQFDEFIWSRENMTVLAD